MLSLDSWWVLWSRPLFWTLSVYNTRANWVTMQLISRQCAREHWREISHKCWICSSALQFLSSFVLFCAPSASTKHCRAFTLLLWASQIFPSLGNPTMTLIFFREKKFFSSLSFIFPFFFASFSQTEKRIQASRGKITQQQQVFPKWHENKKRIFLLEFFSHCRN